MKVVLDTNVLVSALLSPYGAPAAVLNLIVEDKLFLCCDARILIEYRDVLHRERFEFSVVKVDAVLDFLQTTAEMTSPTPTNITLKDPNDLPFTEVSSSAGADYLITGNIRHFPGKIGKTTVISPADFIKRIA